MGEVTREEAGDIRQKAAVGAFAAAVISPGRWSDSLTCLDGPHKAPEGKQKQTQKQKHSVARVIVPRPLPSSVAERPNLIAIARTCRTPESPPRAPMVPLEREC